jgi:hypothetical protein
MSNETRERLAALEHEQWVHWTRYMLEELKPLLDLACRLDVLLTVETLHRADAIDQALGARRRWARQMNTAYADLSEKEKDSDREWADRVLEITGTARRSHHRLAPTASVDEG